MLNDHERSVKKHPWSAKAHDPADLFTLFLLIAMHAAVAAEGLAFHKRTAVYALMCIPAKRLTFLTEALTMMLFPAVQGYHFLYDLLFLLALGLRLPSADSPGFHRKHRIRNAHGSWSVRYQKNRFILLRLNAFQNNCFVQRIQITGWFIQKDTVTIM